MTKNESVETKAIAITKNYMWWAMGAGLVPFPILDIAAVTSVQIKMLHDISKEYGIEFSENETKSAVVSLIGSVTANTIAQGSLGSLIKFVPVIGTYLGALSMSIFSGSITWAIGRVFIRHFESGGTLLNFDIKKFYSFFQQQFQEGKSMVANLKKEKDPIKTPKKKTSTKKNAKKKVDKK